MEEQRKIPSRKQPPSLVDMLDEACDSLRENHNLNGIAGDLEQLREAITGMLEGRTPPAPIGANQNFCIVQASLGKVIFQGRPQNTHLNPMGTVHGGWYATILDSALGCAVHTMLPAGRGYTTSQLNLQLVRSIPLSVERVQAVAEVVHCGRQLATAQSQLLGPDGCLYAHATCTCLIFDLPESTPR